mmetsp:Transcript_11555/g.29597  ORF Transcript_11555/g.29597 Transcript_11555/m.29597 type:complete len:114 (+) Transcript_11555:176-517(+)
MVSAHAFVIGCALPSCTRLDSPIVSRAHLTALILHKNSALLHEVGNGCLLALHTHSLHDGGPATEVWPCQTEREETDGLVVLRLVRQRQRQCAQSRLAELGAAVGTLQSTGTC